MTKAYRTRQKNREIRHALYNENAKKAIGKIEPNINLYCLTKGQFSIINIIEHIVREIGVCGVVIATWTAANYDIRKVNTLKENKLINKIDFILDRSARTKVGGDNFKVFEELFEGHIHITNSHAKFVLIRNEKFNIVVRTSMNLNENKRLENFEISDDKAFYDYMIEICKDIMNKEYSYFEFDKLGEDSKYNKYKKEEPEPDFSELDDLHLDM